MHDLFGPVKKLMESKKDHPRRGRLLIADFEQGRAKGWAFHLGEWAKRPLSIVLSDLVRVDQVEVDGLKVKRSVRYKALLQGCTFNFTAGSMVHQGDGSVGGTICSVQVVRSVSSGRVKTAGRYSFDSGGVVFELFTPVEGRFVRQGVYEGTQLQFILLLRYGFDRLSDIGFSKVEVQYASPVV